jgi:2-C-methyl-D-erythritol 2,4-cyclodiphosphate synthase
MSDVMALRIGHGHDIHALAPGHELWLGGVHVESESGFHTHSDGDVGALSSAAHGHTYK